MKVSSLFNIIADANDVLDFFINVETTEQLVSRLERLKRQGSDDLLACVEGLRGSVSEALDDTLEMSASLDDDDDDDLLTDAELDSLAGEKQNPSEPEPPQEEKK